MIPFNPDFKDLLSSLLAADARFLVVGAFAVSFHGHPRATRDMDVWVEPTRQNADQVWRALGEFGAPLAGVTPEYFTDPRNILQLGVTDHRIDVLCGIEGVEFGPAWQARETLHLDELDVPVIGLDDLIRNKQSTGRLQDAADGEALTKLR